MWALNRGEINDRVLAPSIASRKNDSHSYIPAEDTGWDEDLFEKRYKEGYDVNDEAYMSWLRVRHPESVTGLTALLNNLAAPSRKFSSSPRPSHRWNIEELLLLEPRLITDDEVIEDIKIQKEKKPKEKKPRKKTSGLVQTTE